MASYLAHDFPPRAAKRLSGFLARNVCELAHRLNRYHDGREMRRR
jgi:hypothetical protein